LDVLPSIFTALRGPSLHPRYRASPVLNPHPSSAETNLLPRGRVVGAAETTPVSISTDSPCCVYVYSHACRHHYPGGIPCSVSFCSEERRPSPLLWRIGFHDDLSRPARCSLTLQPAWLADLLFRDLFLVVLQLICYLLNRSRCFWLERCCQPGFAPGEREHLFQGIHNNLSDFPPAALAGPAGKDGPMLA